LLNVFVGNDDFNLKHKYSSVYAITILLEAGISVLKLFRRLA